jgi:hypothetical protein
VANLAFRRAPGLAALDPKRRKGCTNRAVATLPSLVSHLALLKSLACPPRLQIKSGGVVLAAPPLLAVSGLS